MKPKLMLNMKLYETIRQRVVPGGCQRLKGLQCKIIRPKKQNPPGWCRCGAEPTVFILGPLGFLTQQSHTYTGVFVASQAKYL